MRPTSEEAIKDINNHLVKMIGNIKKLVKKQGSGYENLGKEAIVKINEAGKALNDFTLEKMIDRTKKIY